MRLVDKFLRLDRRCQFFILGLLLVGMSLAVFGQLGGYDFINYDDEQYVTANHHVLGGLTGDGIRWAFTAMYASNWHPLTWLSHMLDVELYGLHPGGHHWTSVLLHVVNVVLLLWLFLRMTGDLWKSATVAALFAVHPLHVESVAWVAERKDVLSTMFWMLTMVMYVRYTERPNLSRYLVVALVLALGLMAKPMLVTVPFVLLLLDYWPLGRIRLESWSNPAERQMAWTLVKEKLPLVAVVAASSVITYLAQAAGGAVRSLAVFPLGVRIDNALVAYVAYIRKMLWPSNLAIYYPHPGSHLPFWEVIGAALLLVSITILVLVMRKRKSYLPVGWLWYLGTLVPVIGLIQLGGQAMADRYTYVPMIGLFIMMVWGGADLTAGWRHRGIVRALAVGLLFPALMGTAWLQVSYWRNSETLFEHALRVTTGNYVAHNNLGVALAQQDHLDAAIAQYTEALRIKPDYEKAHNNLGAALAQQDHLDAAIAQYTEALRSKPDYEKAHMNLGLALARQDRLDAAIAQYDQAIAIQSDDEETHNNLGVALAQQGHLDAAIAQYTEALRIKPDYGKAHMNLGLALARQGRLDAAIAQYDQALVSRPDDEETHNNLGIALARQGRLDAAIAHFSQSIRIEPNDEGARYNLGLAQAKQGNLNEAIVSFTRAIQMKPEDEKAHNQLGLALVKLGKYEEAITHFSQALRLRPDDEAARRNLRDAEWQQRKRKDG
jgi:Tfp pilus assembly protein PilF